MSSLWINPVDGRTYPRINCDGKKADLRINCDAKPSYPRINCDAPCRQTFARTGLGGALL